MFEAVNDTMISILGRDKLGILFHLWKPIFHHDGVVNEIQHRNVVVAVAKRISWDAGEIGVGNQLLDAFFLGTAFLKNVRVSANRSMYLSSGPLVLISIMITS